METGEDTSISWGRRLRRALGGHLEAYGDRKKRKLKFKVGLAKVVGGSIGINVEENEDRKKEREALDKR